MICKNCGNNLDDNAKFCGKCGTTVSTEDTVSTVMPNPSDTGNTVKNIGLICFFFPFMSVSCAGQKRDITGTDMIFGDKDTSEDVKEIAEDDDEDGSIFNIFVLIAGVCGVVALAKTKIGAVSAVSLVIFRFSAKSYFRIGGEKLKDFEDYLNVEFGIALWIAIIVFIGAVVSDYLIHKKE